ncbi:hypothetical protein BC938DRAFT_482472 [Jimgerdemannia flammicorona]|uniref:Uncharacterized protein n=1 Tax=Jimgerdemannia flammicorona TaxID=994334 RepID=A0A433QDZ5_9FUNG|nr:hypothetical protein BC938DRAFT_482472 [Jimgerdemannia flammicorona]
MSQYLIKLSVANSFARPSRRPQHTGPLQPAHQPDPRLRLPVQLFRVPYRHQRHCSVHGREVLATQSLRRAPSTNRADPGTRLLRGCPQRSDAGAVPWVRPVLEISGV